VKKNCAKGDCEKTKAMAAWRQRRAPSCFLLILCVDVSASKSVSRVSCENATEATPRNLRCSIKSQALRLGWIAHQQALASEASMYKRDERGRARLVLLGDSITEAFRGTAVGEGVPRTTGQQVVLQQTLAKDFPSPLVLAISADETQHLLWRLRAGGELSTAMCEDSGLIFNLLIGTNNLGNAKHSVHDTTKGILACVEELLRRTRGRVLVNALLPRSTLSSGRRKPPSLMPKVAEVNAMVNASIVDTLSTRYPKRVRMVDCGGIFIPQSIQQAASREEVRLDLMPDALHPNPTGTKLWAQCLRSELAPWRRATMLSARRTRGGHA
jgi:lysophospholipase L1-like esterase